MKKEKILLHICCAGCGAYVSKLLQDENFEVILYYYNPSIFPEKEYDLRGKEICLVAQKYDLDFFIGNYDHIAWLKKIKGLENEPEKGKRCQVCYFDRLEETIKKAENIGCDYFATTLSVSPYKLVKEINRIGQKLAKNSSVKFLERDFKKQDGFKKAAKLSRDLNLYRQNYCGCEFSKIN